ncbi:hypothetical protein KFE25_013294 [Diacronema lutheri]|uniref:Fe2OG dioxygenase domain-containing protein n=2 Tax=Diacronema lutheri TaxID=2081491 RepID=A0A8J5XSM0_DIALT|nr:hypothetical protein KFE25_013294 [Diacronema lutheri]
MGPGLRAAFTLALFVAAPRGAPARRASALLPRLPIVTAPPPAGLELLDAARPSTRDLLAFERDGHCAMRGLLSPAEAALVLAELRAEHARRTDEMAAKLRADHGERFQKREVPFEQLFNLWTCSAAARAVVGSERLARTAATLLGCERVRLYQDTLLVKRRGHGATHWHSDLHMAPLDTNAFVTCWLALTPVPRQSEGGSSLVFASGSHRDCAHLFWAAEPTAPVAPGRYSLRSHAPHAPGDATWHHGWILHAAPPNGADADRWSFAVTFFADGARTLSVQQRERMDDEDSPSYRGWLAELEPGAPAVHERLPLVPRAAPRPSAARAKRPTRDAGAPRANRPADGALAHVERRAEARRRSAGRE